MKYSLLILFILAPFLLLAQEVEMITDWDQAKALAEKEDRNILVILTGSEWCAPCKKMDRNVIETEEFQEYARENLVVFLIDLPGGGIIYNSQVHLDYQKFKEKYEAPYLPSMILTDANGNKLHLITGKLFRLDNVLDQLVTNDI